MSDITKIDIPSLPDSVVSVAIDGSSYLVRMQWMQRIGVWNFTLSTSQDEELVSSVITPNSNLIFPVARQELPRGDFFVYKSDGTSLTYEDISEGACPLYFVGV